MTVKLDLTPEVEASLAAEAHAHGLTLEAYLDQRHCFQIARARCFCGQAGRRMDSEEATRRV